MNISKEKLKRIILEEIEKVNEEEDTAQKCNQDPVTQLNSVIKSLVPLHNFFVRGDEKTAAEIQQLYAQLNSQLGKLKKIRDEYEVQAPTAAKTDSPAPMKKKEFGITQRM
jgi:hypothetical protein